MSGVGPARKPRRLDGNGAGRPLDHSTPNGSPTAGVPDDRVVCVVGAGYVGTVTAAGLAGLGCTVRLVETDPVRRSHIVAGRSPLHEPGLDELIARTVSDGSLRGMEAISDGVEGAGIIIVAVGTPATAEGEADLTQVRAAVSQIAEHAARDAVVVIKSTVPPGTTTSLARDHAGQGIAIVMCPEFLREGRALHDFHNPTRLVVGGSDMQAQQRVAALFELTGSPLILCDSTSAELIKYGSNAFLATKISFINEIAQLCELTGASVDVVAEGMGFDPRVGSSFLNAGLGWGGSCFPKDVRALESAAGYHGQSFWLLKAAIEVNHQQRRRFVGKIREALGGAIEGRRIAVLGLAFKPGTDDMRQAPSLDIVRRLQELGADVVATDPISIANAALLLPATRLVDDPYVAVTDCDAVVLVTEWPAYLQLDWDRIAQLMPGRLVVDGRNCLDGHALAAAGFDYLSVGRQPVLGGERLRTPAGDGASPSSRERNLSDRVRALKPDRTRPRRPDPSPLERLPGVRRSV